MKKQIKYKSPEILMIDCDKRKSDKLLKEGFNIETGTLGRKYLIRR